MMTRDGAAAKPVKRQDGPISDTTAAEKRATSAACASWCGRPGSVGWA